MSVGAWEMASRKVVRAFYSTHRYCPPEVGALIYPVSIVGIYAQRIDTYMLDISAMESIANENPNRETRYIHTIPARPPLGRM